MVLALLEFTAMLLQFPFKCSIIKSRKVESIFMMYIQMKRLHINLDCKISGTTLKVETGSEAGTYKKQK